jgi:hypothetical protein
MMANLIGWPIYGISHQLLSVCVAAIVDTDDMGMPQR